jgi:hypothetical protein
MEGHRKKRQKVASDAGENNSNRQKQPKMAEKTMTQAKAGPAGISSNWMKMKAVRLSANLACSLH